MSWSLRMARTLLIQAAGEALLPETSPEAERLLAEDLLDTLIEMAPQGWCRRTVDGQDGEAGSPREPT